MLITLVYDGHVRSLSILSYSVFFTNSLAGSLELPADMVPVFSLDRIGRRWTLLLAMGLSGIVSLISGVTSLDQTLTIAILAMAGRFFITIAMNTGIQYTVIFENHSTFSRSWFTKILWNFLTMFADGGFLGLLERNLLDGCTHYPLWLCTDNRDW